MTVRGGLIVCAVLAFSGLIGEGRAADDPQVTQQPEFTTLKADFVPGGKTLFFDDFTDMAAGDAPAHFKARGAAPELKASGSVRQLTMVGAGVLTPNLTALPRNFTFEAELKFEVPQGIARFFLVFFSKNREAAAWSVFVRSNQTDLTLSRKLPGFEELGRKPIKMDVKQPVQLALWLQDGRLRAFVNGEKHLDANQVDLPPIDRVEMRSDLSGAGVSIGFRSVRFAESAPDFSHVIASTGRYVARGILFDTGSDRLKPESAPIIQAIAKGLDTNPNLRLLIEGHTDSVGDAAQNLDLSRRRAEAVKAVLVGQFKVDTARLTTAGLGATKPIDSNDTPQGRAENRRVEFVKKS